MQNLTMNLKALMNGNIFGNLTDEYLGLINASLELKCLHQAAIETSSEEEDSGCPIFFDSVLCWPRTPPATWAVQPCFAEFKGVKYDTTQNATRYCHLNGVWDNYTNYEECAHHDFPSVSEFEPHVDLPTYIYCIGYILSLTTLLLATVIFFHFKELRCLRNTIHGNLFVTYILSVMVWLTALSLQLTHTSTNAACTLIVILLNYFTLTNFFWMMVEGLYLYTLVVKTFSRTKPHVGLYMAIGWGVPFIFVTLWAIIKAASTPLKPHKMTGLDIECSWMRESLVDWICKLPACAALLANLIFLVRVMWVLITKLRSAENSETKQYRKASKALLVLMPLLGITYLIVLSGPSEGVGSYIFAVVRAILLSSQGFSVSLFYCFLNSEVQNAMRHRFNKWRDKRNIRGNIAHRFQSVDGQLPEKNRGKTPSQCSTVLSSITS
ncbi:diuretic hormone receptor-like isoform X2 [Lutzomyia longipalpis]|uniref:diuretic hormone receptor-like isoform X2 n=1 Tax=Lutzomyia longipalpis TaxID=7200 RepID=UPI0024836513|nr:diuretic hormone receptor-like isoform X2 [Lutzomyia longipalpis]